MKLKTENIFQVVEVKASPSDIYDLLLDETTHSAFTNKSATIDAREGGNFAFCNNNHQGYFIRLIKNKRIILAWTHRRFPKNHYTIVDLTLERLENDGTRISLNQLGVPESCDGWLTEAWRKTYWEPLEQFVLEEEFSEA
ncbi:SRPBCC domain-containing protein [Sanyastnella coralliicola]|uniref:SRPBCC domain-containing protein n=1 Tax=Sanyastnella coralliicola TaxID=3069118 RepID=UPI0027B8D405|nr:SRPBCC domain-containing protein [Longitalea sp. SCSIO 12813]